MRGLTVTAVESVLLGIAGVGLVVAWTAAALGQAGTARPASALRPGEPVVSRAGTAARASVWSWLFWAALLVALAAQAGAIVAASLERGALAVYDRGEFFVAMSWVTGLALAWFARRGAPRALAVAVLPVALLFLGAALLAPAGSGEVRPASLTSGWLLLHIVTSIVAYAAFSVTFAAGVLTLVRRRAAGRASAGVDRGGDGALPVADAALIERVGYQAAVFGFPFMTMVLFTGALWAKYVWGRYWAWDPIEAWALVTWLVYAAYLHAQYSRRWGGMRAAWLAVGGFACVAATYLFFTHLWF